MIRAALLWITYHQPSVRRLVVGVILAIVGATGARVFYLASEAGGWVAVVCMCAAASFAVVGALLTIWGLTFCPEDMTDAETREHAALPELPDGPDYAPLHKVTP